MAIIEGFRIKNFKALKDVTLGRLWNQKDLKPLTPMTIVIGKNGAGKSTLFDVFGFLADCLKLGVEEACDARGRGGFKKIRSQEQSGAIELEIYYRKSHNSRSTKYKLEIALDKLDRPCVTKESLYEITTRDSFCQLLLDLENGKGKVLVDKEEIIIELEDKRKLGIATLGSLKQHPRISAFRKFIEGWYLSYFTPDAARSLPLAGPQKHLNIHGDNLGNVVQFMEREHPKKFQKILDRIAKKIPGINKISTEKTVDGRLLLKFNDKGFMDPFYAQQMSDGTLKVFAYLLLLEDPTPPPFLCIEEPENGLYHQLLETLAMEFREHATGKKGDSQIFITTHQPYFVNALQPEEVWILEKQDDGFSSIRRVSDIELVKNLVKEELPLGALWYSDYLDVR